MSKLNIERTTTGELVNFTSEIIGAGIAHGVNEFMAHFQDPLSDELLAAVAAGVANVLAGQLLNQAGGVKTVAKAYKTETLLNEEIV